MTDQALRDRKARERAPHGDNSKTESPDSNVERAEGQAQTKSDEPPAREHEGDSLAARIGYWAGGSTYRLIVVVALALTLISGAAYVGWFLFIPAVVTWANTNLWYWSIAWIAVAFLAYVPFFAFLLVQGTVAAAIRRRLPSQSEAETRKAISAMEDAEAGLRGDIQPVDIVTYSRKVLTAYHRMGQDQVRWSFWIGVAAMIFGFMFLLAGLAVQVLETSEFHWLRSDIDVEVIAIGGGIIIEFIAASFLWVYRSTIRQLTHYYDRQGFLHSALLSVEIAATMTDKPDVARQHIIEKLLSYRPAVEREPLPSGRTLAHLANKVERAADKVEQTARSSPTR